MPNNKLQTSNYFENELFNLLMFKSGRAFEYKKNNAYVKDDWSNMIWDLINLSQISNFRRKRLCKKPLPRAKEECFMMLSSLSDSIECCGLRPLDLSCVIDDEKIEANERYVHFSNMQSLFKINENNFDGNTSGARFDCDGEGVSIVIIESESKFQLS